MDGVWDHGTVALNIAAFLARRSVCSLLRTARDMFIPNKMEREQFLRVTHEACLIALTQSGDNPSLHIFRLDTGRGWSLHTEHVPEGVRSIVADGTSLYALDASHGAWELDLQSNSWRSLPPRPPQNAAEAVVVGGCLVVLGGQDERARLTNGVMTTSQVSMYSPRDRRWMNLPSMLVGRGSGFACASNGQSIFVTGGLGDLGVLRSVHKFDLDSQRWSELPAIKLGRLGCAGVIFKDSFTVVGGQFESSMESLTYENGKLGMTWCSLPPVPLKDMWVKAVNVDDRIFSFGRTTGAVFDGALGQWSMFPSIPKNRILAMCSMHLPSET